MLSTHEASELRRLASCCQCIISRLYNDATGSPAVPPSLCKLASTPIMTGLDAKLGILLPVTSYGSRTAETVVDAIEVNVLSSLQPQQRCEIFIGIDFDDRRLLLQRDTLQHRCQQHGVTATVAVFTEDTLQPARQLAAEQLLDVNTSLHGSTFDEALAERQRDAPAAPICWMWWQLALQAAAAGCSCLVLLGDDTTVEPAGTWVNDVLGNTAGC